MCRRNVVMAATGRANHHSGNETKERESRGQVATGYASRFTFRPHSVLPHRRELIEPRSAMPSGSPSVRRGPYALSRLVFSIQSLRQPRHTRRRFSKKIRRFLLRFGANFFANVFPQLFELAVERPAGIFERH